MTSVVFHDLPPEETYRQVVAALLSLQRSSQRVFGRIYADVQEKRGQFPALCFAARSSETMQHHANVQRPCRAAGSHRAAPGGGAGQNRQPAQRGAAAHLAVQRYVSRPGRPARLEAAVPHQPRRAGQWRSVTLPSPLAVLQSLYVLPLQVVLRRHCVEDVCLLWSRAFRLRLLAALPAVLRSCPLQHTSAAAHCQQRGARSSSCTGRQPVAIAAYAD